MKILTTIVYLSLFLVLFFEIVSFYQVLSCRQENWLLSFEKKTLHLLSTSPEQKASFLTVQPASLPSIFPTNIKRAFSSNGKYGRNCWFSSFHQSLHFTVRGKL